MMLGLLCQCMAQSPYQAHRKQCEFCGAEGTSAVVRDADVPRYVVGSVRCEVEGVVSEGSFGENHFPKMSL